MARSKTLSRLAARAFGLAQRRFLVKDISVAERRGRQLGRLAYRLDRKHRERTLSNLAMVFPEKPESEREAMAQAVFENFGIMAGDFLRSPIRTNEECLQNMEISGPILEYMAEARALNKGVLAVIPHLGNWERYGQWCIAMGEPLAVVAREANATDLQEIVHKMREGTGLEVLSQGNAARQILQKLRKNEAVAILPDQNDDECFVPFFGYPAGSVLGPGVLQARTQAPILPACCVRIGVGKYRSEAEPLIYHQEGRTPEETMAEVMAAIERMVRRYPDQYLWMHDRFKNARRRGMLPPGL